MNMSILEQEKNCITTCIKIIRCFENNESTIELNKELDKELEKFRDMLFNPSYEQATIHWKDKIDGTTGYGYKLNKEYAIKLAEQDNEKYPNKEHWVE